MEPLHMLIITGLCSFLVGGILGALFTLRFATSEKKNRDLEKHLHDKQNEIKQYRHEVTEHFIKTSDLLNNLTGTYRDIHNHLAKSASELTSTDNIDQPIIKALPDSNGSSQIKTTPLTSPPLDYAPKTSPYDKGSLTDDQHLEKVELNEKPIEDFAQVIADNAKVAP